MKFTIIGTVCALIATLASSSKAPSPVFMAQIAKNEYDRGFQAGLIQAQKEAPAVRAQQEENLDDLSYTREDGTLVTYDDPSWDHTEYTEYIYSEYYYYADGRKIVFGNPAFNWDQYYAWYYAQTFFYRNSDGSVSRYGDDDFDWTLYFEQQ